MTWFLKQPTNKQILAAIQAVEKTLADEQVLLNQILKLLQPPQVHALKVSITILNPTPKGAKKMSAAKKAAVDFQVQDNGTVKFTVQPLDAAGNNTTFATGTPAVTGTSNNPALTLAADPADTSGFGLSWIGTPTALATGVVCTFSTTLPGATAPISVDADPVDIVAGGATGFSVKEQ